ncbi:hypothetical protein I316_06730 [Kwoniella heveanensis BCC8398]|uniref:Uncharacterized protein n=1 Tax=Kwoniella heveanensis BCC8398 TaxID=1296120 RepID=A0A1B9GKK9_9TREE|nr:hypothetical protein I316_06730 [Kwoniella heveanensis BCC8398]
MRPPRDIAAAATPSSSRQSISASTPPSPTSPTTRITSTASVRGEAHRSARHANSSYFTIPPPSPRHHSHSQRSYAIPPYRPRDSSSMESGSISMTGGTSTSQAQAGSVFGTSFKENRLEALDNWQNLQELVGEEEAEDHLPQAGYWSIHRSSQPPTPGSRSLRSLFISPSAPHPAHASSSRDHSDPVEIDHARTKLDDLPTITDRMTGSPPQLDGGITYSPFTDLEAEDTPRARTQGLPVAAPERSSHRKNDIEEPRVPLLVREVSSAKLRESKDTGWRALWKKVWPLSPISIAIFKCSLSYLIASLFTFVPFLAELLSTQSEIDAHGRITYKPLNQAHMVATIVVYYNPAKTMGSMLLSVRYCFVLAILASIISLAAMGTIELFDHFSPSHGQSWDVISEAGDWVVCILWIGGTMGVLAWSKVWVNNPSYNSGCSMAAITIYSVVIKEGAIPRLLEILMVVGAGVLITNVVCFTVFPSSATSCLQNSISTSLNSFSTLLDLLTSTFLLEKTVIKENRVSIKDAIKSHSTGFKKLKTDLSEAKAERVLDSRIRGPKLHLYDAALASLARLAQHLSSLRSSTRLQESLIRAVREGKVNMEIFATDRNHAKLSMSIIGKIDEIPRPPVHGDTDIETSVRLFLKFREMAGDQMDTLNTRCDEALEAVQALSHQSIHKASIDLPSIQENLATALADFSESSSGAIKRVYAGPRRARGVYEIDSDSDCAFDPAGDGASEVSDLRDEEGLEEGPNETVFLVYFFLFTFEEFAREMLFLLDTMHEIITAKHMSAWDHIKSVFTAERSKKERKTQYMYKQLQNLVPIDPSALQPPPFPITRRDSSGSVLTREQRLVTVWGRIKQAFWRLGSRLGEPDMRYAIKTGLGGAILAAPAYTEAGRPLFLHYRGEWALIAYLAAISQTVGQTNWLSLARVVGTIIGGTVAVIAFKLFPGNNVALPIFGFFFSVPCYYVITQMPDYSNAGRFILLTYNLSCLYTYNVGSRANVTVEQIAVQRSTAVIIGVLWAAAVSRWWWPFTARRELRLGLSDFCLDLSYLYSKLVKTYSRGAQDDLNHSEEASRGDEESGEHSPLLTGGKEWQPHGSQTVKHFMAMEMHLQTQLVTLRGLLAQTKNEPRLKGPFAFAFYNEVLLSCERMLDRLHSMRCVTTRSEWWAAMREEFVVPVNRQRREMAGNVILYFYTLSAGFRTRTPLPPYLPPAEQARQTLVQAIRDLDVVRRRSVRGGGRHLLYFAYATAMQEVIAELDYLGRMMQEAYGVISQSTVEDFEALFETRDNDDSPSLSPVEEEDTSAVAGVGAGASTGTGRIPDDFGK